MRHPIRLGPTIIVALLTTCLAAPSLLADDAPRDSEAAELTALPPARFRVVLNGAFWPSSPSFGENRSIEEYAEQTSIRTSYETQSAFGPDLAVQASVYRGFGIRVGYSLASREEAGTVDVSRPHPLHFDQPRQASAELTGLTYSESALHLDAAFARSVGRVDWSLFAGVTLFRVEADLLGELIYGDVYPYHELAIASTPSVTAESSPMGFNLGGGLDYRFGRAGRFGLGLQLLYSTGNVELQATPEAETISFKAGGLQVAAGVRVYF